MQLRPILLLCYTSISDGSRISRRGGVDLVGGGVDSRGGYVSKILYVKTKELGPLGGVCAGRAPLDLPMSMKGSHPFSDQLPGEYTGLQTASGTDPLLQLPSVLPHIHTLMVDRSMVVGHVVACCSFYVPIMWA